MFDSMNTAGNKKGGQQEEEIKSKDSVAEPKEQNHGSNEQSRLIAT